jgi:hypothetical protein
MDHAVAETITRETRSEAEARARDDLAELLQRAVEAGRERARKIIKVTLIDSATGSLRHNPAGRLLRDWYAHVYLNTLRGTLGRPSEPIDVQQVEDVSSLLRRVRPNSDPIRALQAAGATRKLAAFDAADAVTHVIERLHAICVDRAIRHAPDGRFDGDQLRVHVIRHWYQRCYDSAVDEAVMARHPLAAISIAEEFQVARTMSTREVRRLIGRDGIPLVTRQGVNMTELDRRLAAGETMIVPADALDIPGGDPFSTLLERVSHAWDGMSRELRPQWLAAAGAGRMPRDLWWSGLDDDQQMKLVRHYLATHRLELLQSDFDRPLIAGSDAEVARKMFNHAVVLNADTSPGRTDVNAEPGTQQAGLSVAPRYGRSVHRGCSVS